MNLHFGGIFRMLVCAVILAALAPTTQAQNARLELFEGGDMNMSLGLRSHLLSGAGTQGALSGLIAPLSPDPFVIFGNPAALARIDGRKVTLASSPSIEFDLTTLTDPQPSIKTSVDESLASFDYRREDVTYPEMSGTFGRTGSLLSGFALSLPVGDEDDRWFGGRVPRLVDAIGFGYYEPLVLDASLIYSGLRLRLRTVDDKPENEILLYSSIKTDIEMKLASDSWNVSAAKNLGDFTVGVGFQRTGARIELHGNMRTDGIMSKSGAEASFNDPYSPWDDDYFSSMSGAFDGSCWATRLGLFFDDGSDFVYGAMARLQGEMEMSGKLDIEMHNYKALNFNAAEGEDKFNINAIENISELTKTTPKIFEPSNTMTGLIPSELSIAASYYGRFKPTLTLTKYFGELAYEYEMREDGGLHSYKRGIKPDWAAGLTLNFNFIQVGLGAVQIVDVVSGYHDKNGLPIPPADALIVPKFNIGFDTGLSDNLTLGVLIYGLPEDFLRLTLTYSL